MSDTIEELSKLDKSELIKKLLDQKNTHESLKKSIFSIKNEISIFE
jgi:uncharacterized protein YjgD (DUF1641 family)